MRTEVGSTSVVAMTLGDLGVDSTPSPCPPQMSLWLAAVSILFLSLNQTPDFSKVETKVWPCFLSPRLTSGVLAARSEELRKSVHSFPNLK